MVNLIYQSLSLIPLFMLDIQNITELLVNVVHVGCGCCLEFLDTLLLISDGPILVFNGSAEAGQLIVKRNCECF